MTPTPDLPFRIGTRGSPLALAQARMVADALIAAHGWPAAAVRIVAVTTTGDRIQDRPLAEIGGKALWTKELDRVLIDGDTDCSVHSMKDVETLRPEALAIAATLPRAAVNDRLLGAASIDALKQGARIGTSSPRRAAQLRRLRPDLVIVPLRGNVATRIAKVEGGEVDATLLASAGLDRLGMADVGTNIPVDALLPAVAQGAVGVECRADDAVTRGLLGAIGDPVTFACVAAERALLAALGGTCHSPVAALACMDVGAVRLRAELLLPDGSDHVEGSTVLRPGDTGPPAVLAAELLGRAAPALRALFQPPA